VLALLDSDCAESLRCGGGGAGVETTGSEGAGICVCCGGWGCCWDAETDSNVDADGTCFCSEGRNVTGSFDEKPQCGHTHSTLSPAGNPPTGDPPRASTSELSPSPQNDPVMIGAGVTGRLGLFSSDGMPVIIRDSRLSIGGSSPSRCALSLAL
jgi:hypothetical protein